MKAYVIRAGSTSPQGLELIEREEPQAGPHDILVKMRAASLNFRDLAIMAGKYIGGPVARDTIPLSDGAGEVIAVGADVTRFSIGDRVAGTFFRNHIDGPPAMMFDRSLGSPLDGNLCEYAVFNEQDAVLIPANLSYEEASTLPCAGVTAWHALMAAGKPLQAGQRVLTLGTGGVSMLALQIARAAGAEVISTSSSDEKLARARELGAHHTINYSANPEWHENVMAMTAGKGVDCVVEVGGAGTLARSMQSIGYGGKISMIGVLSGFEGDTNPHPVMFKGGSMHGIFVGNRSMFEALNRAIEINDIHPAIDKVFSFDEAAGAIAHMHGQSHFGKIVIAIGS